MSLCTPNTCVGSDIVLFARVDRAQVSTLPNHTLTLLCQENLLWLPDKGDVPPGGPGCIWALFDGLAPFRASQQGNSCMVVFSSKAGTGTRWFCWADIFFVVNKKPHPLQHGWQLQTRSYTGVSVRAGGQPFQGQLWTGSLATLAHLTLGTT